jgi:hypothetical protein
LGFDGIDEFAEYREVPVVHSLPPGEPPNLFDRVRSGEYGDR